MSRHSILMILGILVMFTPFSGVPVSIRTPLLVIFGACIFGLSFALRTEHRPPAEPH